MKTLKTRIRLWLAVIAVILTLVALTVSRTRTADAAAGKANETHEAGARLLRSLHPDIKPPKFPE